MNEKQIDELLETLKEISESLKNISSTLNGTALTGEDNIEYSINEAIEGNTGMLREIAKAIAAK